MSCANLIVVLLAENRPLRPCQQDRPALVLVCGTQCECGLLEPVDSDMQYKRSRLLLQGGSREATLVPALSAFPANKSSALHFELKQALKKYHWSRSGGVRLEDW
jgi:hypothetical protein